MDRIIKTSIWHRYGAGLLVIVCLFNVYSHEQLTWKIGWSFNALIWALMLIRNANHKVYMRYADDILTVDDGKKSNTFPIADIEYIKMNYHPFSKSYFQLMDGQKIRFQPRALSGKDADSLKEICVDVRG